MSTEMVFIDDGETLVDSAEIEALELRSYWPTVTRKMRREGKTPESEARWYVLCYLRSGSSIGGRYVGRGPRGKAKAKKALAAIASVKEEKSR